MQSDIAIANGKITGNLAYLDENTGGEIVPIWGEGNFIALHFSNFDVTADRVLVGLDPSVSSGLVDVLGDPDHSGVFKITNKNTQRFVVQTVNGSQVATQYYDLSSLVCADS